MNNTNTSPRDKPKSALKVAFTRDLSLFDVMMIGHGAMIGSAVAKDQGGEGFALPVVRVPHWLSIANGRYVLEQGKPTLETAIEQARERDVPA